MLMSAALTQAPAGVVLLAAGRGSRMLPLTESTHKSLLPVAGRPALQYAIEAVLAHGVEDVVVVTGDKRESIEQFVRAEYGERLALTFNERFEADTNILSTELGVGALRRPEDGYLILETDLVVEPAGWNALLDTGERGESFWATRGTYGASLLGGALRADTAGRVTDLVYAPRYDPEYEGWQKLLGALYVGPEQVALDRALRKSAIDRSIAQYYMAPWVQNLPSLACRARSLGPLMAESFNDIESYRQTDQRFTDARACDKWT